MLLALAYSKQFEVIDGLHVGYRENVGSVYLAVTVIGRDGFVNKLSAQIMNRHHWNWLLRLWVRINIQLGPGICMKIHLNPSLQVMCFSDL